MLAAVCYQHLRCIARKTAVAQCLCGDCLTQFGQARCGCVTMKLRVAGRAHRGLNNALGRWEIGLARTETNHIFALGFEGLCLRIYCQGCRFCNGREPCRNSGAGVLMRCHACHDDTVNCALTKTFGFSQ